MSARERQLKEWLRKLVAVDSTSTRSNMPMVDLLQVALVSRGFSCERQTYRDAEGVEKVNLLARLGPPGTPELALVGHTDCVPFDPAWKEALQLTERDGRLVGRGACDTKAFIAAALVAVADLDASVLKKPLLLLFTADEEVGLFGAKELVKAQKGRARYAVIGEPTSLRPIRGHKGYCLADVEVVGKEGHSAYPESGASAIFRAAKLLCAIEAFALGPLRTVRDPAFEPPFCTLNVGVISGGRAKNVIPGRCHFVVEWRPLPAQRPAEVFEKLEALVQEMRRDEPGFEARVAWTRTDDAVSTPESSALVKFLAEQSGQTPTTVAFGTEAPQLTELGAEAVVFGPGDIRVAHQNGEFVPIRELLRAEEILRAAIVEFCSAG